jgi:hypothetical protein
MSSGAGGGVGVAGSLARFGSKGFKHDRAVRGGAKEAYVAVAATKSQRLTWQVRKRIGSRCVSRSDCFTAIYMKLWYCIPPIGKVLLGPFYFFLESILWNSKREARARALSRYCEEPSVAGPPHRSFQTAGHQVYL